MQKETRRNSAAGNAHAKANPPRKLTRAKPENFEFVRQTGQIPVASLEEAWLLAQQELAKQGKDDYKITIMGHASATMPVLEA